MADPVIQDGAEFCIRSIGIFGLGAVALSRGLIQLCIWVNGRHKMFLAANYSEKTDVQTILGKLDGKVLVYVQEKNMDSRFCRSW